MTISSRRCFCWTLIQCLASKERKDDDFVSVQDFLFGYYRAVHFSICWCSAPSSIVG